MAQTREVIVRQISFLLFFAVYILLIYIPVSYRNQVWRYVFLYLPDE